MNIKLSKLYFGLDSQFGLHVKSWLVVVKEQKCMSHSNAVLLLTV